MKTVAKLAAVASVVALTAGSAAWAQTYSSNPGTQGSYNSSTGGYTYNPSAQGSNQGTSGQGSYNQGTYNQGYNQGWNSTANPGNNQGWNPSANQGSWGSNANQGNWNAGMQGTSSPYGQSYSQSGYGAGNINTYQQAEQELGKYGYSNIQGLRAMQGWSADAMRNGERVHVILGENGLVATFPGR
jgi:hypothetical protein